MECLSFAIYGCKEGEVGSWTKIFDEPRVDGRRVGSFITSICPKINRIGYSIGGIYGSSTTNYFELT
jgi:hypothetical protein